jgi:EAL domain-containing protein (putative c-di-GMP-specific phosphodiesterase class I)/CheY-like chemotaxis protein
MTKQRLLILDDDDMIGQTMAYIARSIDIEAHTTTNPKDFFEFVESWQPTHIALDLIMPEMDGVEVLVELADRECSAQIIITSGVGQRVLDAARRSASEHGLNLLGVLSKPFSPALLRQLLTHEVETESQSQVKNQRPRGDDISAEELADAIESNEIELAYQPKVWCNSGLLAGFEALARWRSPGRGLVMPGQFIPVAESGRLINRLTRQVLALSLEWLADACNGQGRNDDELLTMSINMSALTLDDPGFIDRVSEQCNALGIAPGQLIFELTETSAMRDPISSLDLLTRLRMKGFQLSIDDFGTGYSSMLQLVRLPFSEIKVDRSFVMSASRSSESKAVIRSVIELGRSLGLRTTAEGVEDAETLEYLKELRCDLAQGYLIAKPLSGAEAKSWAESA